MQLVVQFVITHTMHSIEYVNVAPSVSDGLGTLDSNLQEVRLVCFSDYTLCHVSLLLSAVANLPIGASLPSN